MTPPTRVLLATDGDFNNGLSDPEALKQHVSGRREGGTYLSVLGFRRGNLNDALMQALAHNGDGQAAYIDTLAEAQKVLVDQLTGALSPIGDDVKIQVEFIPAEVAEYRLIDYETRALRREEFNNDAVDAVKIGAGHQDTALYKVTAPDSPALCNDPLRYQRSAESGSGTNAELAYLRLRWKAPGSDESQLIERPYCRRRGHLIQTPGLLRRSPASASCCTARPISGASPGATPSRWPVLGADRIPSATAPRQCSSCAWPRTCRSPPNNR